MKRLSGLLLAIALVTGLDAAQADVLELRDGSRLEGSFRGADEHSIHFDTREEVHLIPIDQVRSLAFGEEARPAATAAPARPKPPAAASARRPRPARQHPGVAHSARPGATPRPAGGAAARPVAHSTAPLQTPPQSAPQAPRSFEIPVGTLLRVRLADSIDPRMGAPGDRFGGLLETDLRADGTVVIPARTRVYGVVSEARTQGPVASRLKLELTEVMLDGRMLPVVSGNHKLARLPGAAGPANAAPRADRIPAGSLLEFRLLQSLELGQR